MSQTRDQQCFPISKVAADWYELMVLRDIMPPSIVHINRQLDPINTWCSYNTPTVLSVYTSWLYQNTTQTFIFGWRQVNPVVIVKHPCKIPPFIFSVTFKYRRVWKYFRPLFIFGYRTRHVHNYCTTLIQNVTYSVKMS